MSDIIKMKKRLEGRVTLTNELINQEQKDELNRITKKMMLEMSKDDLYFIAEVHAQEPDEAMSKEELAEKSTKSWSKNLNMIVNTCYPMRYFTL